MLQCGTDEQLKIELLSQWKLEAEFRNICKCWNLHLRWRVLIQCWVISSGLELHSISLFPSFGFSSTLSSGSQCCQCSCRDEVATFVDKIFSKLTKYFYQTQHIQEDYIPVEMVSQRQSPSSPHFCLKKEHRRATCLSIITKYMKHEGETKN